MFSRLQSICRISSYPSLRQSNIRARSMHDQLITVGNKLAYPNSAAHFHISTLIEWNYEKWGTTSTVSPACFPQSHSIGREKLLILGTDGSYHGFSMAFARARVFDRFILRCIRKGLHINSIGVSIGINSKFLLLSRCFDAI